MSTRKKRPPPFVLFPPDPTVEDARKALESGDIAKAYSMYRVLMRRAGLPLDWFSPERRGGESLH